MSCCIAVTGGSGFLGGHLLSTLRQRGIAVRALARSPMPDLAGVTWIKGALDQPDALAQLLDGSEAVIHVAGTIKALDRAGFMLGNVEGTTAMLRAAETAGVRRFVHVSSLAAREPRLSPYCESKALAEAAVMRSKLDWTILRLPGIYGPGDRETLRLFRTAQDLVMPIPSGQRVAAWVHAADAASALIAALEPSMIGQTSDVDDAIGGHSHRDFAASVRQAAGGKAMIVAVPDVAVRLMGWFGSLEARISGKVQMLTSEKAREILHPDWRVSRCLLHERTGWLPRFDLATGLADTVRDYRQRGWLS